MTDIAKRLRFRKKPVEIEAFRLGEEYPDWFADAVSSKRVQTYNEDGRLYGGPDYALIHTLECVMRANNGEWIIKGVKGELYPCKPDIFAMTYEPAALLDAPEVVAWQDMKTAPKDGTEILVYGVARCGAYYDLIKWIDGDWFTFDPSLDAWCVDVVPPLCWMLPPNPPGHPRRTSGDVTVTDEMVETVLNKFFGKMQWATSPAKTEELRRDMKMALIAAFKTKGE